MALTSSSATPNPTSSAVPVPSSHPVVEARSLSSITTIAANPPAYPRNPTAKKLDPLVLYIVKVPGSKDIILTPLKPPTKSRVSVEEINASLYYVHVATDEDEAVLETWAEREREQTRDESERKPHQYGIPALGGAENTFPDQEHAGLNHVRRKPVAGLSASDGNSQAGPWLAEQQAGSQQEKRTLSPLAAVPSRVPVPPPRQSVQGQAPVVAHDRTERDEVDCGTQALGRADTTNIDARRVVARRPLPSLPPSQSHGQSAGVAVHPEQTDRIRSASRGDDAAFIGRGSLDSSNPHARPHSSQGGASLDHPREPTQAPEPLGSKRGANRDFRITLIRRDPTHGSQWNVATISSVKDDPGTVDLEIDTPGYGRFAASNDALSLAALGANFRFERECHNMSSKQQGTMFASPQSSDPSHSAIHQTPSAAKPKPRKFHRQLRVSQPQQQQQRRHRHPEESRHIRNPSDDNSRGGNLFLKAKHGIASMSVSMSRPAPGFPISVPPSSKLKSGYYTFTSPWNGICTFSASVNGRSLKCKHLIPNPNITATAAAVAGGNEYTQPATTVAEIRFNTAFPLSGAAAAAANATTSANSSTNSTNMATRTESATNPRSERPSFAAALQNLNLSLKKTTTPTTSSSPLAVDHKRQFRRRPRARSNVQSMYSNSIATLQSEDQYQYRESTSQPRTVNYEPNHRENYDDDDDDDRLDLSLARERAGGGLRGKSAKLGKLIIEDEGIKMLDLVVAACMAVWWRGYQH